MNDKDKERYLRWQDYRIQKMTFSINLFIGLSIATMGFVISEKSISICAYRDSILLLLASSLFFGIIATVSRLVDFRYTAGGIKSGNDHKKLTNRAGSITWVSLGVQLISYLIGAGILLFQCVLWLP